MSENNTAQDQINSLTARIQELTAQVNANAALQNEVTTLRAAVEQLSKERLEFRPQTWSVGKPNPRALTMDLKEMEELLLQHHGIHIKNGDIKAGAFTGQSSGATQ